MSTSKLVGKRRGRPALPDAIERKRASVRRYRAKQRERLEYMQRVTDAAEALHSLLLKAGNQAITIPPHCITADVAETLEKVAQHVAGQLHIKRAPGRSSGQREVQTKQ